MSSNAAVARGVSACCGGPHPGGSAISEAAADVESLVELLRAVADALDPDAMVAAHPYADQSLLLTLVTERSGTVAGALRGLLEHQTIDLGRRARVLTHFLGGLNEPLAGP